MCKWNIAVIALLIILTGCQKDIPEPETKKPSIEAKENVQETAAVVREQDPFFVKHAVKGNDVFVECVTNQVSFRDDEGKIILFVNGKKQKVITSSAFIIKEMAKGTHRIELQLYADNTKQLLAKEEFSVVIP